MDFTLRTEGKTDGSEVRAEVGYRDALHPKKQAPEFIHLKTTGGRGPSIIIRLWKKTSRETVAEICSRCNCSLKVTASFFWK